MYRRGDHEIRGTNGIPGVNRTIIPSGPMSNIVHSSADHRSICYNLVSAVTG